MTENAPPTEPTQEADPPSPKRLTRSKDDRVIAGVAGGVAKYFGIDPVIVRIVAVALVFFGGAGAVLYLAAILLVPNEGDPVPAAAGPQRNRALVAIGAIVLVCIAAPILFAPVLIAGGLLFPLAFLFIAGLVTAWLATGRWPERDAGPIARATLLGLGVLFLLCCVALGAGWGAAAGGEAVIAGLVIAAGVAVVIGAFVRPVRWLIPLALALAIPAGFVEAAGIELDGGYGEKRYRPATAADVRDKYEIGAGELTVDLRSVEFPAGDRVVRVEAGMGQVNVLVPRDVCVVTRAQIGMGAVQLFDRESAGVDVDVDDERSPRPGNGRLIVDADLGLGELDIDRALDGGWDEDRHDFGPGRRFGDDLEEADNPGCIGG